MDELKQSAVSFGKLFQYEYQLVAGSKKKLIDITIAFCKENYMHLVGLHKLTDIQLQRYSKEKIYDMIMSGELTYQDIKKSVFFSEVENRIKYFPLLEQILDSNEIMIKYKRGFTAGTVIAAKYIIVYNHEDTILHFFIDQNQESGKYVGKSFFNRTDEKFLVGQQTFKILKKCKKNLKDNTIQFLVDKKLKE